MRLHRRSRRVEERKFLAEGPQAVREALAAPGVTLAVYATAAAAERYPGLVGAATAAGASWRPVSEQVLAHLADTVHPQGLVALCRMPEVTLAAAVPAGAMLVSVLAQARDPGNAGTVIRVSDAAGADGVVLTEASVDPFNSKCVRASAGSLFHLPVASDIDVREALAAARAAGLQIVAADGAVGEPLDALDDAGVLARPTAWVFGNEAWGLPPELVAACDIAAAVPIHGRAESLNLSTAAAVCLYASASAQRRARRQQQRPAQ